VTQLQILFTSAAVLLTACNEKDTSRATGREPVSNPSVSATPTAGAPRPEATPTASQRIAADELVTTYVSQERAHLKAIVDALCSCADKACVAPERDLAIWTKELILIEDRPAYEARVNAIKSDPTINALRARAATCR
jgi:hypothetical protein